MNEPVTYVNPHDITVVDRRYTVEYQVQRVSGDSASIACFDVKHWDVAVTFTPKPPEIEVGDLVKFTSAGMHHTVLAISGDHFWVQLANDPPFTSHRDIVKLA